MRNDGDKLRSLIKSKGYDLVTLAKTLKVTTAAISKDLQSLEVSRRSLVKYVPVVLDSVDQLYQSDTKKETNIDVSATIPVEMFSELQGKYIALQARFIELQDKHLALTERFFPSAVQQVSITA